MLDLVWQCYPAKPGGLLSHVVIEEVAPGTGWSAVRRWADVLVLGTWPSSGLALDGYEIKASKVDLKRELKDLSKHEAVARYCNHWWLVVWDEGVLVDGLPDSWGVMVTVPDNGDDRALKTIRRAPDLTPEPWPQSFVCSLVRNAYEQSPGAAYVARAAAVAYQRGHGEGSRVAATEASQYLRPLQEFLYGDRSWNWPDEARSPASVIAAVIARLNQGVLAP